MIPEGVVGVCDLCAGYIYVDYYGDDDGVHVRSGDYCADCGPAVLRGSVPSW